jgi:threonine dehydratase
MKREVAAPSAEQLRRAREVVSSTLAPTPLVESPLLGESALLKLETAQPTGSFKVRGALTALSEVPADVEVVTASSGNHALATAWAARRLGRRATIVVARTASPAKLERLGELTDRLVTVGDSYDDAEQHALELAAAGARYVSPYNDPLVIAGQSTIGAELEALDGPLTVAVPVGGGGLVSGVGLWARSRGNVKVVGVEVEASRGLSAAMAAGEVVPVSLAPSVADAIVGNLEPGSVTVEIALAAVDEMIAVEEAEVEEAMRFLASLHGLVVEAGGAVAVAAALAGRIEADGRLVALVTGRNVDLRTLGRVLAQPTPG